MNGYRLSQFVALMIMAVTMSPRLLVAGAEDVIELSAGCALYDAIIAANSDGESGACPAGRGADTIRLTDNITLDQELPIIVSTISIEGEGYSISGNDAFRIFEIDEAGKLSIQNILLTRGFAKRGGAILNEGVLYVDSSQLNNNTSEQGGSAIYNAEGRLKVESSTVSGNVVKYSSDDGGAIANHGDATISRSLFTHNETASGAAINNHGEMRIIQSTLAANTSKYVGAIENRGWLTIEQSDINNNRSELTAGILSQGPTSRLVINNSTISGNQGRRWGGGGISAYGTVILTHVTIVDNVADEAGGINRRESMGGLVILRNSIIAGNSGGDCAVGLHENTNSIIGDGSCDAPISGDPLLEWTGKAYAPAEGSPALDAGDPLYCASVDQIGRARSAGEPCDIGAVEAPGTVSPLVSVEKPWPTPTPTECTLEDQIVAFNTDAPYGACPAGDGADTIVMRGNTLLLGNTLRITSDITIEGNGNTIEDYYKRSQLIEVLGGNLTLRNVTLAEGHSPWTGGAIAVLKGRLTLHNVTVRDSSAVVGGAIFNDSGTVSIHDSRFINNRADDSGSWYTGLGGAIYSSGRLHIHNSTLSANTAEAGGAVYSKGDSSVLEIRSSRFSGNTASGGGAIAKGSGQLAIDQSIFLDNAAIGDGYSPGYGGAISSGGEVRIRNSTFSRNRAVFGGAIHFSDAEATLSHITVVGNSRSSGAGILSHDYSGSGVIKLTNSLIAGNSGYEGCEILPVESLKLSAGNFIEDGSCDADLQGDPLLPSFDAMASTITPQAGSPAIDAGDPAYCLPVDQVGTPRPLGVGCDIGAIEVVPDQF